MRFAYPAVLLCAAACASAPAASRSAITSANLQTGSTAAPAANSPIRGTILTGSFTTEYFSGETLNDVLRRRLPLYLRPRSAAGSEVPGRADPIAVYLDGAYSGGLEVLNLIPASQVFSVQRMSATEAIIRFGPKHNSGALIITLRRP
jgi:hypothetical protein